MFRTINVWILAILAFQFSVQADEKSVPIGTAQTYTAINQLPITVKVVGPAQAQVDLQIICLFKNAKGGGKLLEALDDLDQRFGRSITSLRTRNDFKGEHLETLVMIPPKGSIPARHLMLIGLGAEDKLTQENMRDVGVAALREAIRLNATHVAFAPTIRDQGISKYPTGEVAAAVIKGVIEAYNIDKFLQKEGLAKNYTLKEFIFEAGPTYYNEVNEAVAKAVKDVSIALQKQPYSAYIQIR